MAEQGAPVPSFLLRFHLHPAVLATPQMDEQAVLLKLPSNQFWRLRAKGAKSRWRRASISAAVSRAAPARSCSPPSRARTRCNGRSAGCRRRAPRWPKADLQRQAFLSESLAAGLVSVPRITLPGCAPVRDPPRSRWPATSPADPASGHHLRFVVVLQRPRPAGCAHPCPRRGSAARARSAAASGPASRAAPEPGLARHHISRGPRMSVATTGRPQSIASITDIGSPSKCEGRAKTSAAASSRAHPCGSPAGGTRAERGRGAREKRLQVLAMVARQPVPHHPQHAMRRRRAHRASSSG